jgi:hypothetical protein
MTIHGRPPRSSTLRTDERRKLRRIERHIAATDPDFADRMRPTEGHRPVAAVIAFIAAVYITAPLVMLLGGWPALLPVLILCVVGAIIAARPRSRRRR